MFSVCRGNDEWYIDILGGLGSMIGTGRCGYSKAGLIVWVV